MSLEQGTDIYDFTSFIQEVYKFNDIADVGRGTFIKPSIKDIDCQFKVVKEEVKELSEAIDEMNPVKVLDGVVDSFVTLLGLAKQLEELGFDVLGACQQVSYDNLQKFPTEEATAIDSVESFKNKGVAVKFEEVEVDGSNVFVLLDENNKVRKPVDFKGTDLSKYVPEDFEGFAV